MSNDWWCGLFIGILFTAICFWTKKWCDEFDGKTYTNWTWYSVERGVRVFGMYIQLVIDGKLAGGMVSLWRSVGGDFFIVEMNEIENKRIITLLDRNHAITFIKKYAGKEADQLLKDWFGIPGRTFIET
jgi:hypothetical protein